MVTPSVREDRLDAPETRFEATCVADFPQVVDARYLRREALDFLAYDEGDWDRSEVDEALNKRLREQVRRNRERDEERRKGAA